MTGSGKRAMPNNASSQSAKKRKGGGPKWQKQQTGRNLIESGDWGVFVTCDMGRENKCIAETTDIFSQTIEDASSAADDNDEDSDANEDDIEAQIRKEVEGMKSDSKKPRKFKAIKLDIPCVAFIRLDKSIEPIQLVHGICTDAQAHPEKKRGRYIQRMTPITEIRKTLSVDLEAFAKEILKPHFHSGGPSKKYAIRPSVSGNRNFNRDIIIKTVADAVGPDHPVDLKNYDLLIIVTVIQNIIGMSVVGSDYDQLKRYNLAELYNPGPKPKETETAESKS